MSDIDGRAEDYEQRLAAAGGTDQLMHGLVKAVEQSQRATRLLVIAVIVATMLSASVGVLALNQAGTQSRQDVLIQRQSAIIAVQDRTQADLARQTHQLCVARNAAATSHNDLVGELVTSVKATGGTGAEQAERIARYKATDVPQLKCPPLPP